MHHACFWRQTLAQRLRLQACQCLVANSKRRDYYSKSLTRHSMPTAPADAQSAHTAALQEQRQQPGLHLHIVQQNLSHSRHHQQQQVEVRMPGKLAWPSTAMPQCVRFSHSAGTIQSLRPLGCAGTSPGPPPLRSMQASCRHVLQLMTAMQSPLRGQNACTGCSWCNKNRQAGHWCAGGCSTGVRQTHGCQVCRSRTPRTLRT